MSQDDSLPINLREIAARLETLRPVSPRLDRDGLMYEAGRAASSVARPDARNGTSTARKWKRATFALAACLVVSASLAVHAYVTRPLLQRETIYAGQEHPASRTRSVAAQQTSHPPDVEDGLAPIARRDFGTDAPVNSAAVWRDRQDYLYQRNLVLRDGIDALPLPPSGAGESFPAPTVRELMEELLPPLRLEETEAAI